MAKRYTLDELTSALMLAEIANRSHYADRAPAGRRCGDVLVELIWDGIDAQLALFASEAGAASARKDILTIVRDVCNGRAPSTRVVQRIKELG